MSLSGPGSDSLIPNRIGPSLNINSKMSPGVLVLLPRHKGSHPINLLKVIRLITNLQSNGSKSKQQLVKVQLAGTDIFQTKTINLVLAVWDILFAMRYLYNNGLSYRIAIGVDDLEVDVSFVCLGDFAGGA